MGVGVTVRAKIRVYTITGIMFRAVFDIFILIILEAHVGQTKFPDFHMLSYKILQYCGKGGVYGLYDLYNLDRDLSYVCTHVKEELRSAQGTPTTSHL